jgi:hypothetical protein
MSLIERPNKALLAGNFSVASLLQNAAKRGVEAVE